MSARTRTHEFTPEQVRLLWEIVTLVDVDTLQDNLEQVGALPPDFNLGLALTKLQEALDPDNAFLAEWESLLEGEREHGQE